MNKQVKLNNSFEQSKTRWCQLLCAGVLFSGVFSAGVVAEEHPYEKLSKELDIMNNIFTSSLHAQQDKLLKSTRVDSLYLAKQGVVFTVKSSNHTSWNRHSFSYSFSDRVAPVAPVAPIPPSGDVEFFIETDEIAEQMESAFEQQREYFREFRDQQRDLSYELRDLERENRDLAYQLRNASEEDKKALVAEQKEIKKQKAKLEESRMALAKKSKEIKQKQKLNQEKRLAARTAHYQKLMRSLVDTLCTYGNSLKALPKDEHVSLIVKSAGSKVANNYQDQILVLTKRDINACASDKISAEKLLAKTKQYQF